MDREYTWIIKPDYLYCSIMVVDDYHCTFKFGNKNFHESNYFPYVGYDLEYQMPYMTEYPYSVINPDTGLYGYKNKLDELIIPYIYAGDGYFNSDGLAIVETTNNTFKIIDCFNNSTNEYYGIGTPLFPSYPNDYPSDSIVGVMEKNGLWGIIDAKHDRPPVKRYLVKPQFEDIYECIEGHAAVKKDGKWGLIKINFGKERALSSTEKNDITKKNIIDEIKLYGGDLIILSSVSENDRSTLALNIAEKTTLMYPERNTLILSTKAPKEEIYKKISPSSSITIYDNISTTDGILSTIMNANENSKLGLVIIDEEKYIDVSEDSFIPDELTYDEKIINENLRIETITCSLKALAKRLNIPILLLTLSLIHI